VTPKAKKTAAFNREFEKLKQEMLINRETCAIRLDGCSWFADTLHHRRLRSQGGTNADTIPVCSSCHQALHRDVAMAVENGWIIQRKSV